MRLSSALLLTFSSIACVVDAHATVQAAWINGIDQGQGDNRYGYIRFPPNNSPVKDIQSADMTCNINSGPVAKTLQVKAGDKVARLRHPQDIPCSL
jgi:lytic cellulose monooxygenase (C1-hydroxylating)